MNPFEFIGYVVVGGACLTLANRLARAAVYQLGALIERRAARRHPVKDVLAGVNVAAIVNAEDAYTPWAGPALDSEALRLSDEVAELRRRNASLQGQVDAWNRNGVKESAPREFATCRKCESLFDPQPYQRDVIDNHWWTFCPECYYTTPAGALDELVS